MINAAKHIYHKIPIPTPIRAKVREGINGVHDLLNPHLPPRRIRVWISPLWFDYDRTGSDQLEYFIELGGLRPTDHFLDIACGVGRIAAPLTRYLSPSGGYEGFDLHKDCIAWCRDNISARHPNFNFQVCKVRTTYTPDEETGVDSYVFPYDDQCFEFAYAGSIFTHILPPGAQNYLSQTARVLKPGGRCMATWLLYHKSWPDLIPGASRIEAHWPIDRGDYRIKSEECPELSVAHAEHAIRSMYLQAGLTIVEPIRLDASYCPSRIPEQRSLGMHLYYAVCVFAIRP